MRSTLTWSEKVYFKLLKNAFQIQASDSSFPPIYALIYNADASHLIASAGNDIYIYDSITGALIKRLRGHKDTVTCLASLANGGFASGGADNTVIIWSAKYDGVLKYTHNHSIQALEQEPISGVLVSCTSGDFGLWSSEKKSVDKTKARSFQKH